MNLKRYYFITFTIEILLFLLSVGALTYLAQIQSWSYFVGLLIVCFILFVTLQIAKTKPFVDKITELQNAEISLHNRTSQIGIVDFYNMRDSSQQTKRNEATKNIIMKGSAFSLLGLSAISYIDPGIKRHWEFMQAKIENGVSFRILVMDPFSSEKRIRDGLNAVTTPFDPKFRFDLLAGIYNRYPNVNIRVVSQCIYCSVFFSEEEMIYDPYHLGRIGDRLENNFFALRIRKSNNPDSCYQVLKQHFEYLWSNSEDLERFFEKHKAELQSTPFTSVPINARYKI